ncbi:MAG: hypothetical protein MHMPM18_003631 [Marteilia pararefringens]
MITYHMSFCTNALSLSVRSNQAIQAIMIIFAIRLLFSGLELMRIKSKFQYTLDPAQTIRATWEGSGECTEEFEKFYLEDKWESTSHGFEKFIENCLIDIKTIDQVAIMIIINLIIILILIYASITDKIPCLIYVSTILASCIITFVIISGSASNRSKNQFMRKFLIVDIDEIRTVHGLMIIIKMNTFFGKLAKKITYGFIIKQR